VKRFPQTALQNLRYGLTSKLELLALLSALNCPAVLRQRPLALFVLFWFFAGSVGRRRSATWEAGKLTVVVDIPISGCRTYPQSLYPQLLHLGSIDSASSTQPAAFFH